MFGSENINRKERTDSQYHCDRNISRHIRPTGKEWDQSHYIVDKDEKKRCQQIWNMIIAAALIEGVALLAVVVCLLVFFL